MEDTNTTTGQAPDQNAGQPPAAQGKPEEITAETWLKSLDEKDKGFYEESTKGLKSALDAERASAKDFEKRFKELAGKAEKGSEMETQINELAKKYETEGNKAQFYEQANAKGVTNLRLAWIAANDGNLFKRDGSVDFDELQKSHPELFKPKTAPTNAGSGAGTEPDAKKTINEWIRTGGRQ